MLSMLTLHWHPFRHYWRARNTRKIDINTRNEFSNLAVLCRLRWNSGLFAFELCNIQSTSYYGYGRSHKFYDFHEILTQLPHIDINNVENLWDKLLEVIEIPRKKLHKRHSTPISLYFNQIHFSHVFYNPNSKIFNAPGDQVVLLSSNRRISPVETTNPYQIYVFDQHVIE